MSDDHLGPQQMRCMTFSAFSASLLFFCVVFILFTPSADVLIADALMIVAWLEAVELSTGLTLAATEPGLLKPFSLTAWAILTHVLLSCLKLMIDESRSDLLVLDLDCCWFLFKLFFLCRLAGFLWDEDERVGMTSPTVIYTSNLTFVPPVYIYEGCE